MPITVLDTGAAASARANIVRAIDASERDPVPASIVDLHDVDAVSGDDFHDGDGVDFCDAAAGLAEAVGGRPASAQLPAAAGHAGAIRGPAHARP